MRTAAGAANKKEKCPKEGKEDPKNKQKEKVHSCWVPVIAGLFLLLVV